MLYLYFFTLFVTTVITCFGSADIYCDQLHLGHIGHGVIASYNFPFDYHHNLSCTHRIHFPDNFSQHKICFIFYRFSLENNTPYCYFDNLKLQRTKYCGYGDWQFGYQEDEQLSNLFQENFCWTITKNTFDITFESDNSVTSSGFYATYEVFEENALVPSQPVKQNHAPCGQGYWTCFNRKCVPVEQVCNGQDDCGDASDESYGHARCGEENVLACDFSDLGTTSDGYCGFTNEHWYRTKEKIISGPAGDHTNGSYGHYVYTDAELARLLSPHVSPKTRNKTHCLTFWYYMYGNPAEAILDVFIQSEQAYNRPEWSRDSAPANRWQQAQITFFSQPQLQVIFNARLKTGGVALDDISILEGPCLGADIGCNFESGLCGWSSRQEVLHAEGRLTGDMMWRLHKYQDYPVGPNYDYSSLDGDYLGGYYIYINHTVRGVSGGSTSHRALLVSPTVSQLQDEKQCLRFHYHMLGGDADCCVLKVKLHTHQNRVTDALWSRNGEQRAKWQEAALQITRNTPYQIVLEGWVSEQSEGHIALDKILLQPGDCQSAGGGVCEEGQYLCADGTCIDAALKCDSSQHCSDGSDEDSHAACPTTTTPAPTPPVTPDACPAGQFTCVSDQTCIKRDFLCDGFNDCPDASDETLPACAAVTVSSTVADSDCPHHRCADGQCVEAGARCNGVNDCNDQSDENNCTGAAVCLQTEYLCGRSGECISKSLVCDYKVDCQDGSDEETCSATLAESESLGAGPAVGIAVAILVVVIVVVLVFVVRRRRLKSPPPHSDTCLSTISYNGSEGRVPAEVLPDSAFSPVMVNRHNGAGPPTDRQGQGEEAPPPYDSVVKEQTQRPTSQGSGLAEWSGGQRNSVHRNTLPGMSAVNRNQSWRGGSSRHARVPNNNPQAFVSGLEPRPLHSTDQPVDHSRPHLVSPYAIRNYVPDPTVASNRVDSRNSGVRRSAQRIPGIYPDGPHRILNRPPKLGTTALSNRRKGPANYMNQHPGSQSGYESDSTVPTEPIYETLNLPSDSDRESHTMERRPRSSYLPRDTSSSSVNILFNPQPQMNNDSSTTIRPVSVCTNYPSTGYLAQQRSPHMYSPNNGLHSPSAAPYQFQHIMGPPMSPPAAHNHMPTASDDSQVTVPSSSSGYGSYNGQPMVSPAYSGHSNPLQNVSNIRKSHPNSHHQQPVLGVPSSKHRGQGTVCSREHAPARQNSSVSQGSGEKEHRSTPDSQSNLLPSSNNSSFDQTSSSRNDPNLSGIIFLPDMEQRLLNPTSV